MYVVSATCPLCDTTVDVVPQTLMLMGIDPDDDLAAGWVAWICDICRDWVGVGVTHRQLDALATMGGHVIDANAARWSPATIEPRPPDGQLCLDDLIELHQVLDEPDWFERLLRPEAAEAPAAGDAPDDGR